jgi:hypothetical protein
MACHEIAALRLGLMNVLGIDDPAERSHELAELGSAASAPGPLCSLLAAHNLGSLQRLYQASLADLQTKLAKTASDDPKLGYYRALAILTRKVELELQAQVSELNRFYRELEEMHDFVHEIYPAE